MRQAPALSPIEELRAILKFRVEELGIPDTHLRGGGAGEAAVGATWSHGRCAE